MSKILVIEPYRMLQHAVSTTLFPDHEVQTLESVPDEIVGLNPDLVIVDAMSLRTRNLLGSEPPRWLQDGIVPIVWVDDGEPPDGSKTKKLIVVQIPLTRDRLLAAVAECLKLLSEQNSNGQANMAHAAPEQQLIELVDVIEEESAINRSDSEKEK